MKFFWYAVAGGLATAVHYAVLLILVEVVAMSPAPAAASGALCGAAISYIINRRLAFSGTAARHQQALPRFLLIAFAGAALNGSVVWAGVQLFGWYYLAAQAVATLVVLVLTYRLNRSWTFA